MATDSQVNHSNKGRSSSANYFELRKGKKKPEELSDKSSRSGTTPTLLDYASKHSI